jgi:hypothetical protein
MEKLVLAVMLFSSAGLANSLGPGTVAANPPESFNMSDADQIRQKDGQPAQVRVGLRLLSFISAKTQSLKGDIKTITRPGEEVKRTLRARMNQQNHFIVGDYHIESIPLSFIKQSGQYSLRLRIAKRLGNYGEVEEAVGSLDVQGKLERIAGNPGLYVLKGASAKQFNDSMGRPLLKVVAGFGEAHLPNSTISNATPSNRGLDSRAKNSSKSPLPGAARGL